MVGGVSAHFDWENPKQATTLAIVMAILLCLADLAILTGLVVALAFAVSGFVSLWVTVTGAAVLWTVRTVVPGYAVFWARTEHLGHLYWEL